MRKELLLRVRTLCGTLLMLFGTGALLYELCGQSTIEPSGASSAQILLDVMNTHFTVGRKIPSMYLRIFSDHTVECESLAHTREKSGIVTKRVLTPEEFEAVRNAVDQPELLKVQRRYDLTHPVFDSWMEWDIKVRRAGGGQEINLAGFDPGYAEESAQPYPDALVRLGCSISKLRDKVCGDEPAWRRADCETARKNK
jgi:hypothetical protein